MSVRPEVLSLAAWAPLPPEELWEGQAIVEFNFAIEAVAKPLNREEREALRPLLEHPYDDSIYGLLYGVMYLIESTPDDGWELTLPIPGNPWFELIRTRRANYLTNQAGSRDND